MIIYTTVCVMVLNYTSLKVDYYSEDLIFDTVLNGGLAVGNWLVLMMVRALEVR